jgi:hypothetical protein
MSKFLGPSVYESSRDLLFELITKNLSETEAISPEDELKSVEQVLIRSWNVKCVI